MYADSIVVVVVVVAQVACAESTITQEKLELSMIFILFSLYHSYRVSGKFSFKR